jgi:DNA replication protein DnaC
MTHLGTILSSRISAPSERSWSDPVVCPRCGADDVEPPELRHRCCVCRDAGRIRRSWPVGHAQFGRSELCPACSGVSARGSAPPPAPEARLRIPARYAGARIATWEPPDGGPRRAAEAYVASWPPPKPVLLLAGDRGVGKTHLACGILREVLDRHGVQGQFWPVVDLLDRLRRTADPDRATESLDDVQEQMLRVPLLVLDDLGAHRGTEWAEERLFGLIDARYRDSLPMVVTTNLTLQELAPRVRSRLVDTASSVVVQVSGPDRRLTPRGGAGA